MAGKLWSLERTAWEQALRAARPELLGVRAIGASGLEEHRPGGRRDAAD